MNETSPAATAALVEELLGGLREAAAHVVPRFLATMPAAYFNDTEPDTQKAHLKAIIAARAGGLTQSLTLRNADESCITFVSETSYPGLLAELVQRLPRRLPLLTARVHTSSDASLVLDVFDFGEPEHARPEELERHLAAAVAHAREHAPELRAEALREHLSEASREYVLNVWPENICRYLRLVQRIRGSEDTAVELDRRGESVGVVSIAFCNVSRRGMFERTTRLLGRRGIDIQRAYLDSFGETTGQPVSLLSLMVSDSDGFAPDPASASWAGLRSDLLRLKYLDSSALQLSESLAELGLNQAEAEVAVALAHLVHQLLARRSPLLFTRARILRAYQAHPQILREIVQTFLRKFDPQQPVDSQQTRLDSLLLQIAESGGTEDERVILSHTLEAVRATQRSNVHVPARYALALRLDPAFLGGAHGGPAPHGVFFVHGRDFDGFHVRFRAIARGGLRIVRTASAERHVLESERLYDEAYGLASAQQLKNKDIPEGGSKGVILVHPNPQTHSWAKAYTDALLDLITPDPATRGLIVDHAGEEDLLYLGPDENVDNAMITWIVDRAGLRGYPMPSAFMSSKPGAGINHKRYGITSEGVTVFLEAALLARGIDPRSRPFTVKITGGPDGDVAGNELRILHREYGENARVVGIADGAGSAEDPDGLAHAELLRLVNDNLPITAFDPAHLGPRGRVLTAESPEGLAARDTLHLRLESDAFIPAGGRPQTVNARNWQGYLTPDGRPSSPLIVEGANLFFSPEARARLAEHGAVCVKDSSANKCGVICSSFEILACMVLSEAEFLNIKSRYVTEVIEKLRELAALEAEMLFREARHHPAVPLPQLSERISVAINRASDAVAELVEGLAAEDLALARWFVARNLPPVLVEHAGARLFDALPPGYLARAVGAMLASRIVYREGLGYFEDMAPGAMGRLALRYLRQEHLTDALATTVEGSSLTDRDQIAALLRQGASGTALRKPTALELLPTPGR